MNLHEPLTLTEAIVKGVGLTPTKRFFKPVILIEAPADVDQATALKCGYVFDKNGNAQQFEGTIRPHGELTQATVDLGALEPIRIATEKVAHFAFQRKENKGIVVQFRIHVTEDQDLAALLAFLSGMNKAPFTVVIHDHQISMAGILSQAAKNATGEIAWPTLDENGNYDERLSKVHVFSKGRIKGYLRELQTGPEHFIASWQLLADIKAGAIAAGETLSDQRTVFSDGPEALKWAAAELVDAARKLPYEVMGGPEIKAAGMLEDWIDERAPGLLAELAKTSARATQ